MVAPVSRFSKSARTGTRVPRKTQAPLTLSSERSTSRQSAQPNMLYMICFSRKTRQETSDLLRRKLQARVFDDTRLSLDASRIDQLSHPVLHCKPWRRH